MANSRITSRMKVYRTRIGFHDWIVAATSQKAALKAWDAHQDLFASGAARVVNDPVDVALALKTPGIPVIAPGQDTVRVPEAPAKKLKKPKADVLPFKRPEPQPDRSKLEEAEKDMAKFEKQTAARRTAFAERRKELEAEIEEFEAATTRERRRLEQRVEKERKAL